MLLVGDARSVLRGLPDNYFHVVVTSPPYYKLRGGANTPGFVGWEPSEQAHVFALTEIFDEVRRVLRPDGTCWIVYGDGFRPEKEGKAGARLLPFRLALALDASGWHVQKDIIWSKTTILPESHGRRPCASHEYIFMLSKEHDYFYDSYGEREPYAESSVHRWGDREAGTIRRKPGVERAVKRYSYDTDHAPLLNPQGKALWSVWEVRMTRYRGTHTSTFPPALAERILHLAASRGGCCPTCGFQWVRSVARKKIPDRPARNQEIGDGKLQAGHGQDGRVGSRHRVEVTDMGFSQACSCPSAPPVAPRILDPFGGSGTTAVVAQALGLDWTLIEIDPGAAQEAEERLQGERRKNEKGA